MDRDVRLLGSGVGPEFEGSFPLESSKQDGVRKIREAFCLEPFAQEHIFFRRSGANTWEFQLEVAKCLGLLR